MKYTPKTTNVLAAITYGSHLYGTNGPTSDHDFKAITLPPYRDLILGRGLKVDKYKYDADGNTVPEDVSMPANGYEAEHTPVQKFVKDYLGGQAYAVEFVFAVLQNAHVLHTTDESNANSVYWLCHKLAYEFQHKNVQGMVGFAVKQTFDYVRRGERLNAARAVLVAVNNIFNVAPKIEKSLIRLDTPWDGSETVFDELVRQTGLEVGTSTNQNKVMRVLKLNGREYLETTALLHFQAAVEKLCDQYGERSTRASETDVDWKSLSHAVRVYQQVIELLDTNFIVFPRPNADALKAIKNGLVPLATVKDLLRELDDTVQAKVNATSRPAVTQAMHDEVDDLVFNWIETRYGWLDNV